MSTAGSGKHCSERTKRPGGDFHGYLNSPGPYHTTDHPPQLARRVTSDQYGKPAINHRCRTIALHKLMRIL